MRHNIVTIDFSELQVPGFTEMRRNLLNLAQSLSSLPENALKELEDPASRPTDDPALIERYPSYYRANLWPGKQLPDLESSFKKLGSLIVKVGLHLAAHCDKHVFRKGGDARLTDMLKNSLCHKGRLLHYYPRIDLCNVHKRRKEIDCHDSEAGLYVRARSGAIVKATFGKDDIAYQAGEATELILNGAFHATPHCVRTAQDDPLVERNTFAVFMQPHWDEELVSRDRKTVSFGDFSEQRLHPVGQGHLKEIVKGSSLVVRQPCLEYSPPELNSGEPTFDIELMWGLLDGHDAQTHAFIFSLMSDRELYGMLTQRFCMALQCIIIMYCIALQNLFVNLGCMVHPRFGVKYGPKRLGIPKECS
ncbi:hypothetical protein SELMODRAFT_425855 [Selaginella moellendorffii]|uniref:Isopenicillin N synthase-like Fe(2+) 2OG dioxygenase domain-containing protein n=1 Tax=Selaginella moellendorffii TaxID=88036 RepID=D8SUI4_SELML|nr:hypothetical protein SELMODRAFT_425855 [Selaginella moellendorffii]